MVLVPPSLSLINSPSATYKLHGYTKSLHSGFEYILRAGSFEDGCNSTRILRYRQLRFPDSVRPPLPTHGALDPQTPLASHLLASICSCSRRRRHCCFWTISSGWLCFPLRRHPWPLQISQPSSRCSIEGKVPPFRSRAADPGPLRRGGGGGLARRELRESTGLCLRLQLPLQLVPLSLRRPNGRSGPGFRAGRLCRQPARLPSQVSP